MANRNSRLWKPGGATAPPRAGSRPGAAMMGTDAESGNAGTASGQAQAMHALSVMLDRGLIDQATFEARKAEIDAGRINPEDF